MLSQQILSGVRVLRKAAHRNFGILAPALNKASDPIQQLFVDKIRDYKSKSAGGQLVDASPEIQREMKQELEKLAKQYGGGENADMTAFPQFKFEEPKVDPINAKNKDI
uniref:ATP synthase-coupling factor 6, mitochondrial n=1 Tax=Corethrella appendiculata TaxID=1370023 RepID=U5EUA2_9DIPT